MRATLVLLWFTSFFWLACESGGTPLEQTEQEKSCACQVPNALNAVSIDFPEDFVMDSSRGDSVQHHTRYRIGHSFVDVRVRCGDCDTLPRTHEDFAVFLPPLARNSAKGEPLSTRKFKGMWYVQTSNTRWDGEFYLKHKGPKHWYVQITAQGVDSLTLSSIRAAISSIEIREEANAH